MVDADIIRGPVGRILGLIVWLVVFGLLVGAINGWYLQGHDAGTVSGERFDRLVAKGNNNNVDNVWQAVTSVAGPPDSQGEADTAISTTIAFKIGQNAAGTGCEIAAHAGAHPPFDYMGPHEFYSPIGSEITVSIATGNGDAAGVVGGCVWSDAGSVFKSGGLGGLVEIILQAAGLAPPIALLFALGSFGTAFMKNMGSHPILAAVMTVIMLLLVATLLNTFVPFLTGAFEAIDGNRFLMFSDGLGAVSIVIGNFYGVVVVSSMMMIAWQVVKHLRGGGDVINSAEKM